MTAWTALRTAPPPCPACGAPWKLTEITSASPTGPGYLLRCHGCDHEWIDPDASHGERREARHNPAPPEDLPTTWDEIAVPLMAQVVLTDELRSFDADDLTRALAERTRATGLVATHLQFRSGHVIAVDDRLAFDTYAVLP